MRATLSIAPLIPPAAALAELPEVESSGAQFGALLAEAVQLRLERFVAGDLFVQLLP